MPLPDVWRERSHWAGQSNHFIVSRRLREALNLPEHVAQFRPITLITDDPAARDMGYSLMRLLSSGRVMDRTQSDFIVEPHEPNPIIDAAFMGRREETLRIRQFVVASDAACPADLFWAEEASDLVLVTDAVAERIQAAGCVGVALDTNFGADAGGWQRKHMRRLPGGKSEPTDAYERRPIGPRPSRRTEDRPPFSPTPGLPSELERLEAVVGHRLPPDYAAFLLDWSGDTKTKADVSLEPDPRWAVEDNERVRDHCEWLREGGRWPADWLAIGNDGCGNYWAMDLSRDPCPVLYYDHEYGDARCVAPDFITFKMMCDARKESDSGSE